MASNTEPNIDWNEVIKKESRGTNDADLGEVQEVGIDYVLTKKGRISKDKYYLPKNMAERFDGDKIWFRITEEEAERYKKD